MADNTGPGAAAAASTGSKSSLRVDLTIFILMLALALVGVAVTQLEHSGGRLYWLFLVLVYAGISIVRAWPRGKHQGQAVWPMISAQVFHWFGALVAINVVLFFEAADIAPRGSAADYSLLILGLSCYLAGVHFNWTYLPLGLLLTVMAVGLGYLDQLSVYGLVVPLAALAVWAFLRRGRDSEARS